MGTELTICPADLTLRIECCQDTDTNTNVVGDADEWVLIGERLDRGDWTAWTQITVYVSGKGHTGSFVSSGVTLEATNVAEQVRGWIADSGMVGEAISDFETVIAEVDIELTIDHEGFGDDISKVEVTQYELTQVTYSYRDEEYDLTLHADGVVSIYTDAGVLGYGKWEDSCIVDFNAELPANAKLGLECELFAKLP